MSHPTSVYPGFFQRNDLVCAASDVINKNEPVPLAQPLLVRQQGCHFGPSNESLLQRIANLEAVVAKLAADHNRIADLVDEDVEFVEAGTAFDCEESDATCSDIDEEEDEGCWTAHRTPKDTEEESE